MLEDDMPDVDMSAGATELKLGLVDKVELHSSGSSSSRSSKSVGVRDANSDSVNSTGSSTGSSARVFLSSLDQNLSSIPTSNSPSRRPPNPKCGKLPRNKPSGYRRRGGKL